MASSKQQPVVPVEHFNEREHRRLLAVRANAALTPVISTLASGQTIMWDGEAWINVGGMGTWTPTITFGGAAVGVTYGADTEGDYYRAGNLVYVFAILTLTSKGTSTGNALIGGIPLSVANSSAGTALEGLCSVPFAQNMNGLTSAVSASILDTDQIQLYDWGGSGIGALDDANFTDTTTLRLQGVYVTDD